MKYHGYVPGVIWLQVIRDGMPQLVSNVSLADWYDTAVCTNLYLFFFLPSRCILVTACFVTTGRTSWKLANA